MKKMSASNLLVACIMLILIFVSTVLAALFFVANSIGEGVGFFIVVLALVFVGAIYYKKAKIADSSAMIIGKKLEETMKNR